MSGLTPDEPYVPDDPEIAKITRSEKGKSSREKIEEGAPWTQPKVHEGGTLLQRDAAFEAKLRAIEDKLDKGEALSEADADYIMYRGLTGLMRNRRPSMRAKALTILQTARVKKILDVQGGPTAPQIPTEFDKPA
jgi:hypothetical protein